MVPDDATLAQLALLDEISRILTGRLEWWLFGGWALDFHAGRITRAHSDIEFFVRFRDAPLVTNLLNAHGFASPAPLHPDEGQPLLKDRQEIGAWYLDADAPDYALRGRWAGWKLPGDSFTGQPMKLHGVSATPVSLGCVLEMKRGFAEQPHGAPLRERDIADLALIAELECHNDNPASSHRQLT